MLRRGPLVKSFAARWLQDHPRPRASTNEHLATMIRPLVSELGRKRVRKVTRLEARQFANRHPSSVPAARALFGDAVEEEVIASNPFAKLGISKGRGRKDLVPLMANEVQELANAAVELWPSKGYGYEFRGLVLFAAYVGLRPGELFALDPDDVDRAAHTVSISKSVSSSGAITPPKNGKPRTVVLPPLAAGAFLYPRRPGTLFQTPTGKRFSRTSHAHYWYRLRTAVERPDLEFYELRHFAATHLLERGLTPEDVALQLGHTDGGALVRSTYGHPSEERARKRILDALT